MAKAMDPRIAELMCARMCHDLISPISAINNGIELITEFGEEMKGDALELVGDSARTASLLLQFFRAAFGSANSSEGGTIGLEDARTRTLGCLAGGRFEIDWPTDSRLQTMVLPRAAIKLVMGLVLVATDMLPGAGTISLNFDDGADDLHISVSAEKPGFSISEDFRKAIEDDMDPSDLSPRTVTAAYCRILAQTLGEDLSLKSEDGLAVLSAAIKRS